jgi:hypothetical protein
MYLINLINQYSSNKHIKFINKKFNISVTNKSHMKISKLKYDALNYTLNINLKSMYKSEYNWLLGIIRVLDISLERRTYLIKSMLIIASQYESLPQSLYDTTRYLLVLSKSQLFKYLNSSPILYLSLGKSKKLKKSILK